MKQQLFRAGAAGAWTTRPLMPAGYWPEAGPAMAHLTRVQNLLTARGLTGAERKLKPLLKAGAAAFKVQDLAAVEGACDAVFEAVDGPEKM